MYTRLRHADAVGSGKSNATVIHTHKDLDAQKANVAKGTIA